MKTISLTQGQVTLVDDENYEELSQRKWLAHYINRGKNENCYAMRSVYLGGGRKNKKYKPVKMQNEIMNPPEGMVVDHINGNGLDNRKFNLRICTQQQNVQNSRSKGKFKGAYDSKEKNRKKRWISKIGLNGKTIHIGHFKTEKEAARAYDKKAIELFGEFANLNFPPN